MAFSDAPLTGRAGHAARIGLCFSSLAKAFTGPVLRNAPGKRTGDIKVPEDDRNSKDEAKDHVWLLGVRVHRISREGLLEKFAEYVGEKNIERPRKIMYVNVHCLNLAYFDVEYRHVLNEADIVYPDGIGIILGARICGRYLKQRMTAADFLEDFCRDWAKRDYGLYFFAGAPGIASEAAGRLQRSIPSLRVTGTRAGYFDESESDRIIEEINASRPDILVLGMGSPKQEKWIDRHYHKIRVPLIWPVGALLDYIAGREKRASKKFAKAEWLFRLMQNPGHKWRRYLMGNVAFIFRLAKYFILQKEREDMCRAELRKQAKKERGSRGKKNTEDAE